ncbi:MAG TPA: hypothetical protein VGC74_10180 [Stenotrophomonas sp.]|jgi:hypothetical protein
MNKLRSLFAPLVAATLSSCAHSNAVNEAPALPGTPDYASMELAPLGDPAIRARMNIKPVKWPMRFKRFNFGARCYGTITCSVPFGGLDLGYAKPTLPSSTYGPDYLKSWRGGYGGVDNFPPPVQVSWRSKDGTDHQAEIDLGELFKDEIVRHNVPREEVADSPDGKQGGYPSILLEVNDRTIRVYMRAFISTKHRLKAGNRYSDFRYDLVLIRSYNY